MEVLIIERLHESPNDSLPHPVRKVLDPLDPLDHLQSPLDIVRFAAVGLEPLLEAYDCSFLQVSHLVHVPELPETDEVEDVVFEVPRGVDVTPILPGEVAVLLPCLPVQEVRQSLDAAVLDLLEDDSLVLALPEVLGGSHTVECVGVHEKYELVDLEFLARRRLQREVCGRVVLTDLLKAGENSLGGGLRGRFASKIVVVFHDPNFGSAVAGLNWVVRG